MAVSIVTNALSVDCYMLQLTIYNIPSLVREALPMAITPKNITAGFASTGIWPFNKNIFTEDDFAPSSVTDRPLEVDNEEASKTISTSSTSKTVLTSEDNSSPIILDKVSTSEELISHTFQLTGTLTRPPVPAEKVQPPPPFKIITPEALRPFPKADFSKSSKKTSRARGKTAILTDSPEKNDLLQKFKKKQQLPYAAKRKLMPGKVLMKKAKQKKQRNQDSSDKEDTICLVCYGPYTKSKEDWLQCRDCRFWAHATCANNDPLFLCKNCISD